MEQRRVVRVVEAIASQPAASLAQWLCSAAAKCLDSPGVGVSLAAPGDLLQTVCATEKARDAEALQADLGEGPAYTARRHGRPVMVADLDLDHTWPAFGPAAAGLGIRAVFAFPLRRSTVRLGALTLYREVAGKLSDDHHADALVFARFALDLFLAVQQGLSDGELDRLFVDDTPNTAEIHQAAGMLSVQLNIAVGAALAVLRAHAYADGRSLHEVAGDVVGRRLRLDSGD